MLTDAKPIVTYSLALCALVIAIACGGNSGPIDAAKAAFQGVGSSVHGTVTYRERISLSPDARLIVELRDVSLADAAAPLIARQTIENPGQVPISFKVDYDPESIDSRRRYSIQARIVEPPDRLAFINDTAYEVITGGNPRRVDIVLKLVQPPPAMEGNENKDWRTWVEKPARIIDANLLPEEREPFLRIRYYQSTIEGCTRQRADENIAVAGTDVIAQVTSMRPPDTPWAIPCDEQVVELDAILPIKTDLAAGETYRVIVNGRETATFTVPPSDIGHTFIAESPIERAELVLSERDPATYELHTVSALPKGSSCSHFNGYEIRRESENEIDVRITHHEVSDPMAVCTADYPVVETVAPLGDDFEAGVEYTVRVNGKTFATLVGQ